MIITIVIALLSRFLSDLYLMSVVQVNIPDKKYHLILGIFCRGFELEISTSNLQLNRFILLNL